MSALHHDACNAKHMTVDAVTLGVTDREGEVVALAVIAPSVRYCSMLSRRDLRPIRRFVSPPEWKAVERQVASGLPTFPVPTESPIALILSQPPDVLTVQWLGTTSITVGRPGDAAGALDHHLKTGLQAHQPWLRQLQQQDREGSGASGITRLPVRH